MNRNFGGMGMGGMNRQGNLMGMGQMGGAGMGILGNAPRSGGMQVGGGIMNQQMMQQQMMRDSQLQIVSNLLQQQNQQQQQANIRMMGNQGMLGNMPGMQGMGGIPSLLDMRTKPGMGHMMGQKRGMGPGGPSDYKRMRRNRPPSPMGRRNYRNQDDRRHSRRSSRSPVRSWRDHSPDSRSRRDTERSGSSPARSDNSSDMKDAKEEYDPAKPTEDVDHVEDEMKSEKAQSESGHSDKKDDNLGDLKVTVKDEERSVNRGGSARRKSFEEGDEKKTNYYCHACKKECFHQQNFARHMTGVQHRNTMDKLMNVHIAKSSQLEARMKAEEHLRSIEGKGRSRQHYTSRDQKNRGQRRSRFDNDRDDGSDEFNELVTVDTVGFEDDESRSDKKQHQMISEQDLIIPDYDANTPCGQKYVIAVTGFFCKLCHKFYNNENAAKVTHCQSESHYEKYHKAMTVKVARLRELMEQKQKEEEESKKAEEERKKEEEKVKKEEDDDKQSGMKEEKGMEEVEDITLGSPGQDVEDEVKALLAEDDKESDTQVPSIPGLDLLKETDGDEQNLSLDGNEDIEVADMIGDADKDEVITETNLSTDSEVVETTNAKSKGRGGGKVRGKRGRRGKN